MHEADSPVPGLAYEGEVVELTCRWCMTRPGVPMMMSGLWASASNWSSIESPPTSSATCSSIATNNHVAEYQHQGQRAGRSTP